MEKRMKAGAGPARVTPVASSDNGRHSDVSLRDKNRARDCRFKKSKLNQISVSFINERCKQNRREIQISDFY